VNLEDAADDSAVGQHIVIVVVPIRRMGRLADARLKKVG
jgi:hypothetical protein